MLHFVQPTTWEDVFQDWKRREGSDPGWIHCATILKGWPDWESWRRFTAAQVQADERAWNLFEFTDPMRDIPMMLVGPFAGWQAKLPVPNRQTFADLVRRPEQAVPLHSHERVAGIMKHFPPSTTFFGLKREDTGAIVCLEGHHRATAVALCELAGDEINFGGPVRVALADLGVDEVGLLDQVLARGTTRAVK